MSMLHEYVITIFFSFFSCIHHSIVIQSCICTVEVSISHVASLDSKSTSDVHGAIRILALN